MKTEPNDRLSRTVSAIYRLRTAEPDPMGDPSGDCGHLIEAHERAVALKAVKDAGYETPGQYNEDLRSRMVGEHGRMSYHVYHLLVLLEIQEICPRCGSALDVSRNWTQAYGGGWDTYYMCPTCPYAEVYV